MQRYYFHDNKSTPVVAMVIYDMAGRTVLVIAHRLSTIREADQIAVLHHGQLREVGCNVNNLLAP